MGVRNLQQAAGCEATMVSLAIAQIEHAMAAREATAH
jgi:hypothetical protein